MAQFKNLSNVAEAFAEQARLNHMASQPESFTPCPRCGALDVGSMRRVSMSSVFTGGLTGLLLALLAPLAGLIRGIGTAVEKRILCQQCQYTWTKEDVFDWMRQDLAEWMQKPSDE